MPYANRVTPFNELIATSARGTLTGNRGILHDRAGRIVRPFAHRNWVTCLLEFKGRHRRVMAPGRYTHLFFLDEVTALAAGHRPCGECRRADYLRFRAALARALRRDPEGLNAGDMDRILHADRVTGRGAGRYKPVYAERFGALPDGAMFRERGPGTEPGHAATLKWGGAAWAWSPEGYREYRRIGAAVSVEVLTPKSTVEAIRAGYLPSVHATASAALR